MPTYFLSINIGGYYHTYSKYATYYIKKYLNFHIDKGISLSILFFILTVH